MQALLAGERYLLQFQLPGGPVSALMVVASLLYHIVDERCLGIEKRNANGGQALRWNPGPKFVSNAFTFLGCFETTIALRLEQTVEY